MLISAYYGSIAAVFGAPGQDEPWSDGTGWIDG